MRLYRHGINTRGDAVVAGLAVHMHVTFRWRTFHLTPCTMLIFTCEISRTQISVSSLLLYSLLNPYNWEATSCVCSASMASMHLVVHTQWNDKHRLYN
jgi:hypothetical protein